MTIEIVEKLETEAKKLPRWAWVTIGVVLLLVFLFFRKRAKVAAQNQDASNASDGMVSALQLPGGLQFAPLTSGGSGGVGNNQDSGFPGMTLGDLTDTGGTTNTSTGAVNNYQTTAATIPGGSSPASGAAPAQLSGGEHTGILINGDPNNELSMGSLLDFFRSNKVSSTSDLAQLYNFGHQQGLSNLGISHARYLAQKYLGVDTYNLSGGVGDDPSGAKFDALVASTGTGTYKAPTSTATAPTATATAPKTAQSTVTPPQAASGPTNAEIFGFYSSHQNDTAALQSAMKQYNLTDAQVSAAGVPLSALHPAPAPAPAQNTPYFWGG